MLTSHVSVELDSQSGVPYIHYRSEILFFDTHGRIDVRKLHPHRTH